MAALFRNLGVLVLISLCGTSLFLESGPRVVSAQEDDEDAVVEEEGEVEDDVPEEEPYPPPSTDMTEGEEEEEDGVLKSSPDADFVVVFISHRAPITTDLLAGAPVTALIGLSNIGEANLIVSLIEGSLRFPQDFSYHIQNFTGGFYEQYVAPGTDASFSYEFTPSELFTARSFGLVVNVYYKDENGSDFRTAVFNDTINIIEKEEGFDGETFFMYVFMISGLCLLMFVIYYVYTTVYRKGGQSTRKAPVETGTQGKDEVDMDWIPDMVKKSPKPTPSPRKRQSPRGK